MSASQQPPNAARHHLTQRSSFTVDVGLLAELGERLIGRPHIAIAELVKNAYDADAEHVTVQLGPQEITVRDDGIGMSTDDFQKHWLRLGTQHKRRQPTSKKKRLVTGSKGIGRLSCHFLGDELELISRPEHGLPVHALVSWHEINAKAGQDITAFELEWEQAAESALSRLHGRKGTLLRISRLRSTLDETQVRELARQLWNLRPPFQSHDADFAINLEDDRGNALETFSKALSEPIDQNWEARIVGKIETRDTGAFVTGSLRFHKDKAPRPFSIPVRPPMDDGTRTHYERAPPANFEIRIYRATGRQAHGVKVNDFRQYLDRYGGVRVFDAGFALPYYGQATSDWLGIERDHAHRLSKSRLLPSEMQRDLTVALHDLPTMSRILGSVSVDTHHARNAASQNGLSDPENQLTIQASRDRLVENKAFRALADGVRTAVDLYAVETARRKLMRADHANARVSVRSAVSEIRAILAEQLPNIPDQTHSKLSAAVDRIEEQHTKATSAIDAHLGLLGGLATTGIAALAMEHEAARLDKRLQLLIARIKIAGERHADSELLTIAKDLEDWMAKHFSMRELFSPMLEEANRTERRTMRARHLLASILQHLTLQLTSINVSLDIPDDLLLPPGTVAEWNAIFQNILMNARNALLGKDDRRLRIRAGSTSNSLFVSIDDSGTGLAEPDWDRVFEPFYRLTNIPSGKTYLGYGGTGLGLTIVRMVATSISCVVQFVKPPAGWSTTFQISWKQVTR